MTGSVAHGRLIINDDYPLHCCSIWRTFTYLITVHNSSCWKVMFSQVCVIACWDIHPLGRPLQADTPLGRPLGRRPPGRNLPGQTNPQALRHFPPGQTTPPPERPLQRTVRILLECVLVKPNYLQYWINSNIIFLFEMPLKLFQHFLDNFTFKYVVYYCFFDFVRLNVISLCRIN